MVRFLFRQRPQKIHAPHLTARVFFLPEQHLLTPFLQKFPYIAQFAVLLPRGSYKNSVDMHDRRRQVYNALRPHLLKEANLMIPACFCGILPRDTFFALSHTQQEEAAKTLLLKFTSTTTDIV